jgi:hypothetical protein
MTLTQKALWTALAAIAPLSAHATVPNSTFQFYFEGPFFDEVSSSPTYVAGALGVTIRGYNSSGKQVDVDQRWDGVGVSSSALDVGEITSSLLDANSKGEYLVLSFNKTVNLSSLRFSMWENGLFDSFDHATVSWGATTVSLGNQNDNGLLLKTFTLPNAVGNTFTIRATGALSDFRLAGINATAVVPEPASYSLMVLGLLGLGLVARRRQR